MKINRAEHTTNTPRHFCLHFECTILFMLRPPALKNFCKPCLESPGGGSGRFRKLTTVIRNSRAGADDCSRTVTELDNLRANDNLARRNKCPGQLWDSSRSRTTLLPRLVRRHDRTTVFRLPVDAVFTALTRSSIIYVAEN